MSDPFLGEIKMFAGNFAPQGYAFANGQVLPIVQNTALFSLYGTYYGGDGKTTFALPNLQGQAPMAWGNGASVSPRVLGETGGTPTVTLTTDQMPGHSHAMIAEDEEANLTQPTGNAMGVNPSVNWYTTSGATGLQLQNMSPALVATAGGGQPHNNLQPYLAISFIVALQGIFPPRG